LFIGGFKMKKQILINNEDLIKKAVGVLLDQLGPVETNRFLTINPQKRMDSVRRHQIWQTKLNKKDFFKEIFNR